MIVLGGAGAFIDAEQACMQTEPATTWGPATAGVGDEIGPLVQPQSI